MNLSFRLEERKGREVTAVRTSYMFSLSTFRYLISISHTASPGSVEMRAGACREVVAEVLVNHGLEAYKSADVFEVYVFQTPVLDKSSSEYSSRVVVQTICGRGGAYGFRW